MASGSQQGGAEQWKDELTVVRGIFDTLKSVNVSLHKYFSRPQSIDPEIDFLPNPGELHELVTMFKRLIEVDVSQDRMETFLFKTEDSVFRILCDSLTTQSVDAVPLDLSEISMNTSMQSEMEVASSVLEELHLATAQILKIIVAVCSGEAQWNREPAPQSHFPASVEPAQRPQVENSAPAEIEEVDGAEDVDDACFPSFGGPLAATCAGLLSENGVVAMIIGCAQRTEHVDCYLTCLDCIFSICCLTESARKDVASSGAIEFLVSVLADGTDSVARAIAASCFAPLSKTYFARLEELRVPELCARRLSIDVSLTVRLAATEALRALVSVHPSSTEFLIGNSVFWQCMERRILFDSYSEETEFSLSLLAAMIKRCSPLMGNVLAEKRWFVNLIDSSMNVAPASERCLKICLYMLLHTSPQLHVGRFIFSRTTSLSMLFDLVMKPVEDFPSQWVGALLLCIALAQDPICRYIVRKQMSTLLTWSAAIRVQLLKAIPNFPDSFLRSITFQDVFSVVFHPDLGPVKDVFTAQDVAHKRSMFASAASPSSSSSSATTSTAVGGPTSEASHFPDDHSEATQDALDGGGEVGSPPSGKPASLRRDYVDFLRSCFRYAVQLSFPIRKVAKKKVGAEKDESSAVSSASPTASAATAAAAAAASTSASPASSTSRRNGRKSASPLRAKSPANSATPGPGGIVLIRGEDLVTRGPDGKLVRRVAKPVTMNSPALLLYSRETNGMYRRTGSPARRSQFDLVSPRSARHASHPDSDPLLTEVRSILTFSVPVASLSKASLIDDALKKVKKAALFAKRASVTAPVNDKNRRRAAHDATSAVQRYEQSLLFIMKCFDRYTDLSVQDAVSMLMPADSRLCEQNVETVSKLLRENEADLFASSEKLRSNASTTAGQDAESHQPPSANSVTVSDPSPSQDVAPVDVPQSTGSDIADDHVAESPIVQEPRPAAPASDRAADVESTKDRSSDCASATLSPRSEDSWTEVRNTA
eukprot:ANDGO_07894.mRNA.1 hypothetical protein